MSVSGRPVFVLRGAQASHRDMRPGSRGPDVRQLEVALSRLGFSPGPVDGRYDGETGAAVARWYESEGWEPFGSTDAQLDALRTARANAAQARDAYLQSLVTIKTTRESVPPGDIAQARIDLETARDNVDTAQHTLATQGRGVTLALANERRDNAVATADIALKRAAMNKARDTQLDAQRTLAEAPPGTSPSELAALQAAARQAADDVAVAQEDLNASVASADATREAGRSAVATAKADRARALRALPTARRQVVLAEQRLRVLTTPGDTSLHKLVSEAAKKEADGTARDVARLARKMGIQVPADEVLFFSTLPLRVDSVRVRRGDTVSGRVMTVSNSRLAIDSSLSPNDAKLVRPGATVKIEEPDLGVKTTGIVTQVADRPGTHKVDPGRVYVSITPSNSAGAARGRIREADHRREEHRAEGPHGAGHGALRRGRRRRACSGAGARWRVPVREGDARARGPGPGRGPPGERRPHGRRPRGVGHQGRVGGRRRHLPAERHEHHPQGLQRDLGNIRNVKQIWILGSVRVLRHVGDLGRHDEQGDLAQDRGSSGTTGTPSP